MSNFAVIDRMNENKQEGLKSFERFSNPLVCDICERELLACEEQTWEFTELGFEVELDIPIIGICCTDHESCRARERVLSGAYAAEQNSGLSWEQYLQREQFIMNGGLGEDVHGNPN